MKDLRGNEAQQAAAEKSGSLHTLVNAVGIALCVIFIPIIIVNILMIVRSYTDPDNIPSVFGFSPVIVLSGSMSPEFEAGDMIVIGKTDPAALQAGDVICYLENEAAVTHRILEVQGEGPQRVFVTRGDANNVEDAVPVTMEQVQGKYTGVHLAGLGDAAIFLQSTPGMLIFIGGPVLLFLLWDILRRMISGRKDRAEMEKMEAASADKEQEMAAMEEELRRLREKVGGGEGESADKPSEL